MKKRRLPSISKRRPAQKQVKGFNKSCDLKVWYETEGDATLGLWRAQISGWLTSKSSVYKCKFCNGFHITSGVTHKVYF